MRFGYAIGLTICLMVGATCLVIGANSTKSEAAQKGQSCQGVWTLVSGEAAGTAMSSDQTKNGKLTIHGDQYTVTLSDLGTMTGTQKLGVDKDLKTIDIVNATGHNTGKTCLGIYELKGDEFIVVFAGPDDPRPTKFATLPETSQWMHTWKRVK